MPTLQQRLLPCGIINLLAILTYDARNQAQFHNLHFLWALSTLVNTLVQLHNEVCREKSLKSITLSFFSFFVGSFNLIKYSQKSKLSLSSAWCLKLSIYLKISFWVKSTTRYSVETWLIKFLYRLSSLIGLFKVHNLSKNSPFNLIIKFCSGNLQSLSENFIFKKLNR